MEYATNKIVHYPNVVTLSQIYSMMCQRYIEDGITKDVNVDQSNEIPLESVPVNKSLDTAVGRASIRLSTKPHDISSLPITQQDAQNTQGAQDTQDTQDTEDHDAKITWEEFCHTCSSLLKILGEQYCKQIQVRVIYSISWYLSCFSCN